MEVNCGITKDKSFELHATFALHNLAVTLMKQSRFAQAFEIQQSAVTTLQIALDAPGQEDGRRFIRRILRQALKNTYNFVADEEQSIVSLRVVQHDDAFQLFEFPKSPKIHYTVIGIQEKDPNLLAEESINFLTAIVLFNFAVVSLAKIMYCANQIMDARQAYQGAITTLHLALNLLDKDKTRSGESVARNQKEYVISDFSFSVERGVYMTAIILQTLQQSLLALGYKDEAFACVVRLSHTYNQASILFDIRSITGSGAAAA